VSKFSFTAVLAAVLAAGIGYLAFDPTAARDLSNWVKRQVGEAPDAKKFGHPNYTPVVPGR
jgi:hypothetical protein